MSGPKVHQIGETDGFVYWREQRGHIQPYLNNVYAQIEPLLEDAESIVDLGGGEGHTLEMLPDEFAPRITTVDLDGAALDRLQERHPEATTHKGDMNAMPFDDGSFDAAIGINAVGGEDAEQNIMEAARVLKPGGILLYLYDIPSSHLDIAYKTWMEIPEQFRGSAYVLPYLNTASGNVDMFAVMLDGSVKSLEHFSKPSAKKAVEKSRHLLGEGWNKKIYGDMFMVATYSKLFRHLADEMRSGLGAGAVDLRGPLMPNITAAQIKMLGEAGLEPEVLELETDYETDEPHVIEDRVVASLFVDQMVLPHVDFSDGPQAGGTSIKGNMPVFVGRKP